MTKPCESPDITTSQSKNSQVIETSREDKWVGYWEGTEAGESELELPDHYVALVVLKGEITLTFNRIDFKTIGEKSLVLIVRKQLTNFEWKAGTALLEFIPPVKIFRFFASCSNAFQIPCSTIVPVRPELQAWVDDLMAERLQPQKLLTDTRRREYCMRLGSILRSYPSQLVGELCVPFHACSLSGEKKCKDETCV